jgi:alpha-galactosidase
MFANGIRLSGLDLLSKHRVAEGMALCLDSMDIDEWGKQDRIKRGLQALRTYGGAARHLLPRLRDLEAKLVAHREAKGMQEQIRLCREVIAEIEADENPLPVRTVAEILGTSAPVDAAAPTQESTQAGAPTLKVFILAGQSNMQGHGTVPANPDRNGGQGSLEHLVQDPATAERFAHLIDGEGNWVERDDVWIDYFERAGRLAPGYGSRADQLGPELGFGHVVGDAIDNPVLLIKVAWGGKSLAVDFRPPSAGGEVGPFYTQLLERIAEVLATLEDPTKGPLGDLAFDGYELAGFGWHQGWNDRINQGHNDAYEGNMAHFIRDVRKALDAPELPFVVAETGMTGPDEKHPRALSLMAAQRAVAEREEFERTVSFVPTRSFWRPQEQSPTGQGYHWNSNAETYYLIGDGMGQAMVELLTELSRTR